jgi:type II secretory pathway pseudopilin PulG
MASTKIKGFTMTEILGVVAVVLVIATVSMISVKDSVTAGQRAVAQRELQTLNTALNDFTNAGGVIKPTAKVDEVVLALRKGVELAGSDFIPLTSEPLMETAIAGIPYKLNYGKAEGFTYQPTSGSGEILGGTGGGYTPAADAGTGIGVAETNYPFDITDPAAVDQALNYLRSLDPSDPVIGQYLNALNSAYTYGTADSDALTAGGLGEYEGTWVLADTARLQNMRNGELTLARGGSWEDLSTDQKNALLGTLEESLVRLDGRTNWEDLTQEQKEQVATAAGTAQVLTLWAPIFKNLEWEMFLDHNYFGHKGVWFTPPQPWWGSNYTPKEGIVDGAAFVGVHNNQIGVDLYGADWSAWFFGPIDEQLNMSFTGWGFAGPPPSNVPPTNLTNENMADVITDYVRQ